MPSVIHTVECGHRACVWSRNVIGRREALLERQMHMSLCQWRPRVERGTTSMLMCRNRVRGCNYVQPFKTGQQEWATRERSFHERNVCEHHP